MSALSSTFRLPSCILRTSLAHILSPISRSHPLTPADPILDHGDPMPAPPHSSSRPRHCAQRLVRSAGELVQIVLSGRKGEEVREQHYNLVSRYRKSRQCSYHTSTLPQVNDPMTLQNPHRKRICADTSPFTGRITSILPRRRGIYSLFPHHVRTSTQAIPLPSILLCSRTLANQTTALHPVHPRTDLHPRGVLFIPKQAATRRHSLVAAVVGPICCRGSAVGDRSGD